MAASDSESIILYKDLISKIPGEKYSKINEQPLQQVKVTWSQSNEALT